MGKLASAWKLHAEGGWEGLTLGTAAYLLNRAAPRLQSLFGHRLHQQLWAYTGLGYLPDVENPTTFNEKLIHRKLFTDDDRYATVEDKWAVRGYVAERVGHRVLPEVYHSTKRPETIPFESLPDEYVIKPTHLFGAVRIVDEGDAPDQVSIVSECQEWLDERHGQHTCEYWYDDIEPRIIIEERLCAEEAYVPYDYKLYVFHGRVEYIGVHMNRFDGQTVRYYDREWTPQSFAVAAEIGPKIDEPERLDELIAVAEELAKGFDFIRVDMYHLDEGRIVFGELTVTPGAGRLPFIPRTYDFEFGSYW